ncbi:MAG: dTMP kinase [Thermoproteales archaeon]|nr:dTMP kinase [Thermoproteales archaeon]
MNKGIFIVFEGIDGSGTTSNSKLITAWLEKLGYPTIWTSEPTQSDIGMLIKKKLKTPTLDPHIDALLFAADRIWHIEKIIKPNLEKGYIVISDRYFESSIAYQGAQGVDIKWIQLINKNIISPDITIILDISPEKSLERIKNREIKEKFESMDFLKKVREIYLERAKIKNYYIIDAEKEINYIQEKIKNIILRYIQENYSSE